MPWAPQSQPQLNQSAFDSGKQEIHSGDLTFLTVGGEKGNETADSKSKPGNLGHHEHITGRVNKDLIVHQPLNYQGLIRHIPTAFIGQDSLYCPALFERPFNLFPLLLILIGVFHCSECWVSQRQSISRISHSSVTSDPNPTSIFLLPIIPAAIVLPPQSTLCFHGRYTCTYMYIWFKCVHMYMFKYLYKI